MPKSPTVRFIDFYDQERYLFEVVGPRFRSQNALSAFDFFCIIIWKANRAKSIIARRLMVTHKSSLDQAVQALTRQIARVTSNKDRLEVLTEDWGFRLPMASAILTVLYPDQFTVYDVRVCKVLNGFKSLANTNDPVRRWKEYCAYVMAVQQAVQQPLSLRDKDRWLWGQSFAQQLHQDIEHGFPAKSPANSDA